MVDEHRGQLVADGALHQGGRHGGVDATGQGRDHASVTDLLADQLDLLLDDVAAGPGLATARDVDEERLEDPLTVLAVQHLGVPLHAGEPAPGVLECSDGGTRGVGVDDEALGRRHDLVAVRHPRRQGGGHAGEQRTGIGDAHGRTPVLSLAGMSDAAAQCLRHRLEAVADAEHGHLAVEQRRIELRGTGVVDR